jgi:hypothetical protein
MDKLVAQAERQIAAAGGRQIIWHFAEQEAAQAFAEALQGTAAQIVEIVVTAP